MEVLLGILHTTNKLYYDKCNFDVFVLRIDLNPQTSKRTNLPQRNENYLANFSHREATCKIGFCEIDTFESVKCRLFWKKKFNNFSTEHSELRHGVLPYAFQQETSTSYNVQLTWPGPDFIFTSPLSCPSYIRGLLIFTNVNWYFPVPDIILTDRTKMRFTL